MRLFRKAIAFMLSLILLIQGTAWYTPAFSQEKSANTMAVLDFIANGVSETEARTLSGSLRGQMTREIMSSRYKKLSKIDYTVVDRSQMERIFEQFDLQNTGCTDVACAIEFGKILNVDKIVIGEVGLIGRTYTFNASIVDVETSKVIAAAEYTYSGAIDNLLSDGLPHIIDNLLYGKRRSKKWYYIGGAVLAAGIAAFLILQSTDDSGNKPGEIIIEIPVPQE